MRWTLPAACCLSLAALAGPAPEAPKFSGTPRVYWQGVCARCHGVNGDGRDAAGRQLPDAGFDFTDVRKATRRKDRDWIRITLEGKEKMPAFKDKMTAAEAERMVREVLRPFAAQ